MTSEASHPPAGLTPRDILVRNELIKYSATYVNGIAIAVFAVGGLAPLVTIVASGAFTAASHGLIYALAAVCWAISGALHWSVRRSLRGLVA